MELMLVGVSVLSFVIASGMSLIAWKLLREQDERSGARVALLQAAVEHAIADSGAIDLRTTASRTTAPAAASGRLSIAPIESAFDDDPWDFKKTDADRGLRSDPKPAFAEIDESGSDDWDLPLPAGRPLFEAPDRPRASTRRIVAAGIVGLIVIGAAGTPWAIRGGHALLALTGAGKGDARTSAVDPAQPPPIELLSLRHDTTADGTFVVTGLVQNPSAGREISGVSAVVSVFDAEGRVVATGRAELERGSMRPGQAAPFAIRLPDAVDVSRYRVGFRLPDGGVVSHLDRRDALTTSSGDERVDRADHVRTMAPLTPRRTEG